MLAIYYPFLLSVISCFIIGILTGTLGIFALLKKESLLGDTISHASLPGVVLSLYLTGSKDPHILLLGGACTGIIGTCLTVFLEKTTTLKKDTILGIILSVFFGLGLVLTSHIQKFEFADQALIHKFLFGNASVLLLSDLYTIIILAALSIGVVALLWKELVMETFNPEFAHATRRNATLIHTITLGLLIGVIVVGLQVVGVILMSSLLIAPAAAARQWSTTISLMLVYSICIATSSCLIGSYISMTTHLPTGPLIIVLLSCIVTYSLLYGKIRVAACKIRGLKY